MIAFVFPGQGAQTVGMGKDLYDAFPAARSVFDRAEQVTGLPIKSLCFDGPAERLNRTDVAQPAIFTVSSSAMAAMKERLSPERWSAIQPAYLAGLSLGEYTALYAAGAMSLDDALRLVARRGQLMQQAAEASQGGMVAVLGLDEVGAEKLCQAAAQGQLLVPANYNCPGQIVLSGDKAAIARAEAMAKDFGASGAKVLDVAGAFHCSMMMPAAVELSKTLQAVSFSAPRGAVVANVDAKAYECPCEIAGKLLMQLTGATCWQQCMEYLLAQDVERFYEIGPGRSLAGMMKRINRRADVVNINSVETLEKVVAEL